MSAVAPLRAQRAHWGEGRSGTCLAQKIPAAALNNNNRSKSIQ
jgi:hypothetical protein